MCFREKFYVYFKKEKIQSKYYLLRDNLNTTKAQQHNSNRFAIIKCLHHWIEKRHSAATFQNRTTVVLQNLNICGKLQMSKHKSVMHTFE